MRLTVCKHMGSPTGRMVECRSCAPAPDGRVKTKLRMYVCDIHGECTPALGPEQGRSCADCPDHSNRTEELRSAASAVSGPMRELVEALSRVGKWTSVVELNGSDEPAAADACVIPFRAPEPLLVKMAASGKWKWLLFTAITLRDLQTKAIRVAPNRLGFTYLLDCRKE